MSEHQTFIPLETNEKFKFFCALNNSVDRKVLFSRVLDFDQVIKAGTRLIVKAHIEKDTYGTKDRRYRLFLDESQTESLPRSATSQTNHRTK